MFIQPLVCSAISTSVAIFSFPSSWIGNAGMGSSYWRFVLFAAGTFPRCSLRIPHVDRHF